MGCSQEAVGRAMGAMQLVSTLDPTAISGSAIVGSVVVRTSHHIGVSPFQDGFDVFLTSNQARKSVFKISTEWIGLIRKIGEFALAIRTTEFA